MSYLKPRTRHKLGMDEEDLQDYLWAQKEQGVSDKKIAADLDVSQSTVMAWRKWWGIGAVKATHGGQNRITDVLCDCGEMACRRVTFQQLSPSSINGSSTTELLERWLWLCEACYEEWLELEGE